MTTGYAGCGYDRRLASRPQGLGPNRHWWFCCTSCSARDECVGWTYEKGNCSLFSSVVSSEACPVDEEETLESCLSGVPGRYEKWTTLPQNFRENGYLTLGTGKYFHDGCGLG